MIPTIILTFFLTFQVSWNKSTESDVAFYNIYVSNDKETYRQLNEEMVTENFFRLVITRPEDFFYCVSAVDSSNNESKLSEPISVLFAPLGEKFQKTLDKSTKNGIIVVSEKIRCPIRMTKPVKIMRLF
jgi:hypothetical protein